MALSQSKLRPHKSTNKLRLTNSYKLKLHSWWFENLKSIDFRTYCERTTYPLQTIRETDKHRDKTEKKIIKVASSAKVKNLFHNL